MSDDMEDLTRSQLTTRVVLKPEYNAASTAAHYSDDAKEGGAGLFDMCMHLSQESARVQDGDLTGLESMLTAQAHTLDVMFAALAKKASKQMDAGFAKAADIYLRLALKAQSQCRTTVEAIAEIKYPRAPTFVKQQNVGQNVQVNNGVPNNATSTRAHAPAREKDNTEANKLLEASDGERLDVGATGAAGGVNQDMAAVGAVNRSKDGGGQGDGGA